MQIYLLFFMSVNSSSKAINFSPLTESEEVGRHIVLTSYGLGNRGIVAAFLAGSIIFPLLVKTSTAALGPNQLPAHG
jgi:hypothetical protein